MSKIVLWLSSCFFSGGNGSKWRGKGCRALASWKYRGLHGGNGTKVSFSILTKRSRNSRKFINTLQNNVSLIYEVLCSYQNSPARSPMCALTCCLAQSEITLSGRDTEQRLNTPPCGEQRVLLSNDINGLSNHMGYSGQGEASFPNEQCKYRIKAP